MNSIRTHYWWLMGFGAMPPEALKDLSNLIVNGFTEDKEMLESMQQLIDRDSRHREYPEFSFKGDAGGVLARRALQRILADDGR
jgi:hypothetical protein